MLQQPGGGIGVVGQVGCALFHVAQLQRADVSGKFRVRQHGAFPGRSPTVAENCAGDLSARGRGQQRIARTPRPASTRLASLVERGLVREIAFCSESERQAMLVRLAASNEPGNFMALKPTMVERLLNETRRLGYGHRTPDFGGHFDLTRREWNDSRDSIALPILVGEEVIAALNFMWMHKVATVHEMVKSNLPHLTAAAREISRRLVATSH